MGGKFTPEVSQLCKSTAKQNGHPNVKINAHAFASPVLTNAPTQIQEIPSAVAFSAKARITYEDLGKVEDINMVISTPDDDSACGSTDTPSDVEAVSPLVLQQLIEYITTSTVVTSKRGSVLADAEHASSFDEAVRMGELIGTSRHHSSGE